MFGHIIYTWWSHTNIKDQTFDNKPQLYWQNCDFILNSSLPLYIYNSYHIKGCPPHELIFITSYWNKARLSRSLFLVAGQLPACRGISWGDTRILQWGKNIVLNIKWGTNGCKTYGRAGLKLWISVSILNSNFGHLSAAVMCCRFH